MMGKIFRKTYSGKKSVSKISCFSFFLRKGCFSCVSVSLKRNEYQTDTAYFSLQLLGNKANRRISERVLQENKARQIF